MSFDNVSHLVGKYGRQHRIVIWEQLQQASVDEDVFTGERKRVQLRLRDSESARASSC